MVVETRCLFREMPYLRWKVTTNPENYVILCAVGMGRFFGHPLLVNCGEAFYMLDKVDDSASPVRIYLKPAKFRLR